jgi:hypothetical protein
MALQSGWACHSATRVTATVRPRMPKRFSRTLNRIRQITSQTMIAAIGTHTR